MLQPTDLHYPVTESISTAAVLHLKFDMFCAHLYASTFCIPFTLRMCAGFYMLEQLITEHINMAAIAHEELVLY
jgi:hypothetical protein